MAATREPFVPPRLSGQPAIRRGELICAQCGSIGKPVTMTPGNLLFEIILWCLFLLPGLIYSLYRMTGRKRGCRQCGSTQMVPPDSPVGRRLLAEMQSR